MDDRITNKLHHNPQPSGRTGPVVLCLALCLLLLAVALSMRWWPLEGVSPFLADGGSEEVSAEGEQGLLPGAWEGTWFCEFGGGNRVRVSRNEIVFCPGGPDEERADFQITDEGEGKCRIEAGTSTLLGIYKREGAKLVFCFGLEGAPRPAEVKWEKFSRHLVTLHRARPGK